MKPRNRRDPDPSQPHPPLTQRVTGFGVRPPANDSESAAIQALFPALTPDIQWKQHRVELGAFSTNTQPADTKRRLFNRLRPTAAHKPPPLLGAVVARPGSGGFGTVAHFRIAVPPFARRRGIGRTLFNHLVELARANGCTNLEHAGYLLNESDIHQFCLAQGMHARQTQRRYHVAIEQVTHRAQLLLNHLGDDHPDLQGVAFRPYEACNPDAIAQLLVQTMGGFTDEHAATLRAGHASPTLSIAAQHGDTVLAVAQGQILPAQTEPGQPHRPAGMHVQVLAALPHVRRGPVPVRVFVEGAKRCLAQGLHDAVFDTDLRTTGRSLVHPARSPSRPGPPKHRMAITLT